jgi:hypothetical protein
MADKQDLVTAAELDAMTPNERLAVFEQHIVTDLNQLPETFRNHVIATANRLGEERRAAKRK